jgi:hypothetical protein
MNFTYSCSNETNSQLITIYTLRFEWEFLEKQIYFANIDKYLFRHVFTQLK